MEKGDSKYSLLTSKHENEMEDCHLWTR